ncbi:hypothetical protein MTE01_28640 [Microbacterium testaceum]|uniref:Uncharacterized protein n=1 Tax=Microbacterium testaceum TaxID=2033 RepID=A0A4Y3QPU4_MICTE|nr:hypothetical protein [Microbacterium testaceum]GEB46919.1 hypothetical protein MTE01_28640 [Microbacterium testaceum]
MNVSGILLFAFLASIPATVYLSPASWRERLTSALRRPRFRRDPFPGTSTEGLRRALERERRDAVRDEGLGYVHLAASARASAKRYERALRLRGEEVPS